MFVRTGATPTEEEGARSYSGERKCMTRTILNAADSWVTALVRLQNSFSTMFFFLVISSTYYQVNNMKIIIRKYYEVNNIIFISISSVCSVGVGWGADGLVPPLEKSIWLSRSAVETLSFLECILRVTWGQIHEL